MNTAELKEELINKLLKACFEHLEYLNKDLSTQTIFAYAIYCGAGCRGMGVAACTRESLRPSNFATVNTDEPAWYKEVNASEWSYVNKHYELFDSADEFVEQLYSIFYDGELDDIDLNELDDDELWTLISNFFVDTIVCVLTSLKNLGAFSARHFEDDLLLGIQFGDPDKYALDMIELASKRLNSKSWHDKVSLNCNIARDALK